MLLWIFQSTLPARGATEYVTRDELNTLTFQSTLPARGATDGTALPCRQARISIHAPRTGSDSDDKKVLQKHLDFNPRSPHGERPAGGCCIRASTTFQSTLPARGATLPVQDEPITATISIHAPRTGSDETMIMRIYAHLTISIHAPRTGSDTRFRSSGVLTLMISIHAPRTGSDAIQKDKAFCINISIHAPRTGSDPRTYTPRGCSRQFQSTLPARGATSTSRASSSEPKPFQSTLPARGATAASQSRSYHLRVFQSTLPARGATRGIKCIVCSQQFQSTLPARGATLLRAVDRKTYDISIHAPRTGSDLLK